MTVDKTITCRDCGQQFVFSAREQEFFAERGFGDPVRCLNCRREHKARKMAGTDGAAPGADRGGRPAPPPRGEYGGRPDGPRPPSSGAPHPDYRERRPMGDDRTPAPRGDGYRTEPSAPQPAPDWGGGGREDGGGRRKEKRRGRESRGWDEDDF